MEAEADEMGGHLSHEYHFMNSIGDEKLLICTGCNHSTKETEQCDTNCLKCGGTALQKHRGIEVRHKSSYQSKFLITFSFQVGHTFYLGDTFTRRFKADYLSEDGEAKPMEMGCHGIGVTRLLGAAIECLSTDVHLRWPFSFAPFSVCIIPPEKRSKAFEAASHHLDEVYLKLNKLPGLMDDVVVDDRIKVGLGERFRNAKRFAKI